MSTERTPTTEMIRGGYARAPFELDIQDYEIGQSAQGRAKAFDRWLAAHDRAVKAEAWDEGAHTAWERSTPEVNGQGYHWRSAGEPHNPYRDDEMEKEATDDHQ